MMGEKSSPDLRRCADPLGSIIMVAGAGGRARDWDGQLPLAERYNVLRFQISGDAARDARVLIGICREKALFRPHLLGHSLGSIACESFCGAAALPANAAFSPATLALVCPVGIPKGSPAARVMLIFEEEGAAADLPAAARIGLSCQTSVILAHGHYPFRDRPAWFNAEYERFLKAGR